MAGYMPPAGREDWRTPPHILDVVRTAIGRIGLDPCAGPDVAHYFADENLSAPQNDGLAGYWNRRTVYVNPPFGDLARWTAKAVLEHVQRGAEIVFLLPARTDTRYWHTDVCTASAVCLWRGRITFVGAPAPAPFPVAFVYWGPNHETFRTAFGPHGMVFRP